MPDESDITPGGAPGAAITGPVVGSVDCLAG